MCILIHDTRYTTPEHVSRQLLVQNLSSAECALGWLGKLCHAIYAILYRFPPHWPGSHPTGQRPGPGPGPGSRVPGPGPGPRPGAQAYVYTYIYMFIHISADLSRASSV